MGDGEDVSIEACVLKSWFGGRVSAKDPHLEVASLSVEGVSVDAEFVAFTGSLRMLATRSFLPR